MTATNETAVRLPHSDHELEALLPAEPERLLCGLAKPMHDSALCADQDLGHMEEHLLRGGHEVFRQMLEKGAQLKADQAQRTVLESNWRRSADVPGNLPPQQTLAHPIPSFQNRPLQNLLI